MIKGLKGLAGLWVAVDLVGVLIDRGHVGWLTSVWLAEGLDCGQEIDGAGRLMHRRRFGRAVFTVNHIIQHYQREPVEHQKLETNNPEVDRAPVSVDGQSRSGTIAQPISLRPFVVVSGGLNLG